MYCTIEDLKQRLAIEVLIDRVDDEGLQPESLEEADEVLIERIDAAIRDATDEINGYAQTRYKVPFDPIPGLIRKLAADMSIYHIFSRRGFDENGSDKTIVDRYKNAIRTLENLSKGIVTIGTPKPTPVSSGSKFTNQQKIFGRDKMSGY